MSEKFDENKRRILAMNKPDELHSYVPQSSIIVSRNCTLPDVSTTQDVLTSIKTSNSIENTNPDYYKQELARIAELEAENAELRDVIGDYRNDASRVLDEKCPTDERHCGCVPILRDQLNKYQKALILITTMPELSQATTIAREALQERGKFIWTEQSVGEYWVTKLDILQDKIDSLEKDYEDVCQKRLEAADVFSRQIIELEAENAELKAERRWIPVSEMLPEEKQSVLALHRTGTAYHWEYSRSLSNIFVGYYTHWMPMPEPPEVV